MASKEDNKKKGQKKVTAGRKQKYALYRARHHQAAGVKRSHNKMTAREAYDLVKKFLANPEKHVKTLVSEEFQKLRGKWDKANRGAYLSDRVWSELEREAKAIVMARIARALDKVSQWPNYTTGSTVTERNQFGVAEPVEYRAVFGNALLSFAGLPVVGVRGDQPVVSYTKDQERVIQGNALHGGMWVRVEVAHIALPKKPSGPRQPRFVFVDTAKRQLQEATNTRVETARNGKKAVVVHEDDEE